ncbi:hypothetical protein [Streptomyces purpurogeneiscleroticus]|nr:hypothetical protein [Streptomyces purpurogeneiscleroticus]
MIAPRGPDYPFADKITNVVVVRADADADIAPMPQPAGTWQQPSGTWQ